MSDFNSQPVILCDMCMGEDRKPARKTCMKCEISMCVQHLQVHLTTPVLLQTHPLTEPMAPCGTTKCPQHGKLLEYYCLDDMTCVCVSCAIEDQHRLHNMKTFSTAHKELSEKLKAERKALLVEADGENGSLEKWEKSEGEKVNRCSVRLIEAVTNLRDLTLTSVQSSVSARMVAIKTSRSSMQEAQKEKDTFRFLQMYAQVHEDMEKAKAVDLRKGLEPGSHRDKLVREIIEKSGKTIEESGLFCESLLTMIDPERVAFATRPDLTFEPQALGTGVSLSKNSREVFYHGWLGQGSATLLIRSTGVVPDFQRWTVSLSNKSDWTIGLHEQKSVATWGEGRPVFGLSWKNNQLFALKTEAPTTEGTKVKPVVRSDLIYDQGDKDEPVPPPDMVEVFWNRDASSLTFFERSGRFQQEEITTIKQVVGNWDLNPFVQLGVNKDPYQSQRRCSCGTLYKKDVFRQLNCLNCGAFLGNDLMTEMMCELH